MENDVKNNRYNNYNNKQLKQIATNIKPEFNLGKNGITNSFLDNINKYLKAHSIVKIKCLIVENKSSLEYLAKEIAKETNSKIIDKRGFTFVLYKKN